MKAATAGVSGRQDTLGREGKSSEQQVLDSHHNLTICCIALKITPSPKKAAAAAETSTTGLLLHHPHKLTTTQICSHIGDED